MSKENTIEQVQYRGNDAIIIDLVRSILNNAEWTIETVNESVLVKLMERRGTPIEYDRSLRDIDADFKGWLNDRTAHVGTIKAKVLRYWLKRLIE